MNDQATEETCIWRSRRYRRCRREATEDGLCSKHDRAVEKRLSRRPVQELPELQLDPLTDYDRSQQVFMLIARCTGALFAGWVTWMILGLLLRTGGN